MKNAPENRSKIISSMWQEILQSVPESAQKEKDDLVEQLNQSKLEISKLLLGETLDHPGPFELNNLINSITAEKGQNLKYKRNQIVLLGALIEAGNKLEIWKLPLPPVPVFIQREKTPFIPSRMRSLKYGHQYEELLIKSIEEYPHLSDEAKLGQVLLSAILRGGILNIVSINALHKEILSPIKLINDRSFIDLSLRWQGHDDVESRRWFPDPITEMLILRIKARQEFDIATPWKCIKALFREMDIRVKDQPKNLTSLIDPVVFGLQLKLPPFVVNYAIRSYVSHSLKEHVWLRLNGVHNQDLEVLEEDNKIDVVDELLDKKDEYFCDPEWAKQIREAIKTGDKPKAKKALSACLLDKTSWPPIAIHLCEWLLHLIQNGSLAGGALSLSTVRNYYATVWMRLYGIVGEQDVTRLNVEAFEEIYGQILEDSNTLGMRRKLARILREFHVCLVHRHYVPDMAGSVFSYGNALAPVDANIVTIEDFNEILLKINNSDLDIIHSNLPKIAKIISIIAFRCGLRRSEVLKLRIIDVQGKIDPEILVRPHAIRRLKTKSSTRRILLGCLLELDELDALLEWVKYRKEQEEEKDYSPYLFSISEKQYAYVPEELIFPAIHKAMREATGDQSMRFHHFRHSCASWNILRLMIADHGMPEHFFEHLPQTYAWLEKSSDFKKALYRHENPTRKHLYAIASILGHSSPNISLEHYIHWNDIILSHVMSGSQRELNNSVFAQASGLPRSTALNSLTNGGEQSLLKAVRRKSDARLTLLKPRKLQTRSGERVQQADIPISETFDKLWKLLYLRSARKIPIDDLAERYGFTTEEATSYESNALQISLIKGKDRFESFRHLMEKSDGDERLLCPNRPRGHVTRKLVEDFAGRFHLLMQSHREDSEWLLNYFLENAWSTSNDLVFREPQAARKFLNIVQLLGLKRSDLIFTWYYGHEKVTLSGAERRRYWRNALDFYPRQSLERKQLNKTRPLGEYGWLGVKFIDYLDDASKKDHSSYAFRYVLVMFSILMGSIVNGD